MPPKKRGSVDDEPPQTPPPAFRTRAAVNFAPWQLSFGAIDGMEVVTLKDKDDFKSKLLAKNLTDAFLPYMTSSQLQKRLNIKSHVSKPFMILVQDMQRSGLIKKDRELPIPSSDDYDLVIAAIRARPGHGAQMQAIDDHFRLTGVMCHSGNVSKRMSKLAAGASGKRLHGKLSQASIDTLSNLMYAATCDTNCKPLSALRNFARAAALLEQFYGSQEEYLIRNRQPAEQLIERPRVPRGFFSEHGEGPRIFVSPAPAVTNQPLLPASGAAAFSPCVPSAVGRRDQVSLPAEVTPHQTPSAALSAQRRSPRFLILNTPSAVEAAAHVGQVSQAGSNSRDNYCQTQDTGTGAAADAGADSSDATDSDSSSSSDGSEGDRDDEEYHSVPPPQGRDISNFNFAWNGPMPSSKRVELSLRWPRKSQMRNMMKRYGWQAMKAQWVDMHRRSGAFPPMLTMYFDEKERFMTRNQIVDADQELNGDESLLRGDITEQARTMKFIICRGPRGCAQDKHAYATRGAVADNFALVVFPVVSRNRCVFLQIILKGNPSPKAGSQTARKQVELARDVVYSLPFELQSITYVNFTKKGYQTAESFKDASRALLVALHNLEMPGLNMSWSTPMVGIPPLRRKYMFKVDGSKTHGISDHQFLLEIESRRLLLFPYTPNATAFVQELDQLILWLFKSIARRIVRLELAAMSERPNFSNRFVQLVWAENVAAVHNIPVFNNVYESESQENFAISTEASPSGHVGFTSYEVAPEVCAILNRMADRIDQPWGPVRLACMFGHALSAALLNPDVLNASFDAVLKDRVFRRPLVIREQQFQQHVTELNQRKTNQLADLAASMSGNLTRLVVPREAAIPDAMVMSVIEDSKWDLFVGSILRSQGPQADIRGLCTIYSSFSNMYDEAHKRDGNVAAFRAILDSAGDAGAHVAALEREQQVDHDAAVDDFRLWIQRRVDKMASIQTDCSNGRVQLRAYTESLAALNEAIPPQPCSKQALKSFASQLKQLEKSAGKVRACIETCRKDVSNLQQKVADRKASKFPNADRPLSPDVTEAFDTAANDALHLARLLVGDLQLALLGEVVFADIRVRILDLPAPVPRARGGGGGGGRARGGGDGGGRARGGGDGGGRARGGGGGGGGGGTSDDSSEHAADE
jgi:hypothetical protein